MAAKLFAVAVLTFVGSLAEEVTEKKDSVSSGSEFVHLSSVQFPSQPVFPGSHDLTPLQQTHVLSNFHHRFHPTRFGFNFGVNQAPLVFPPQTHIVPPQQQQQHISQGTHNSLHHLSIRPPVPHQESQQSGLLLSQPNIENQPNFKPLGSSQNHQNSFGSIQDQSIKNSFPSNAPHTIKFSISSQNYSPSQNKQYLDYSTPPPKINHQVTSSLSQTNFRSQLVPDKPIINQEPKYPNQNYQQANQFASSSKGPKANFQSFNIGVHQKSTFGSSSSSSDVSSQYNPNLVQVNSNFRQNLAPESQKSFDVRQQPDVQRQVNFAQPPLIQSSIELKQSDFVQQHPNQFEQQQTVQTKFSFPKAEKQESYLQFTSPPNPQFSSTERLPKFNQVATQAKYEYRTTEAPRFISAEGVSRQPNPVEAPRGNGQRKSVDRQSQFESRGRELAYRKSQDQLQYALTGNFLSSQPSNEISSPAPEKAFTAVTSGHRKPKPVVKEIRINLNDPKLLGDGLQQVYIKEDGDKKYHEIKLKNDGEQKEEKSQEEIINEQIQKLLQTHNLEIIGKNNETQTDSQEVQLNKVSEQFKKFNYSVQLLNGAGLLSGQPKTKPKAANPLPPIPELPEHIRKQYDVKVIHRDELLKQYNLPSDHQFGNDSSNFFLANGQQLEIVKFGKDGTMSKLPLKSKAPLEEQATEQKTSKVLFDELTKGVIPPGANFELIKHKGDGQVEKVEGLSESKKVTFVFLEEQPDGSVKVQGVKGNGNQGTEENEINSLIEQIKDGSLKLPPSQKAVAGPAKDDLARFNSEPSFAAAQAPVSTSPSPRSIQSFPSSAPDAPDKKAPEERPTTEFSFNSSPYSVDLDSTPSYYNLTPEPPTTFVPTLNYIRSSTRKPQEKSRSRVNSAAPVASSDTSLTPAFGARRQKPAASSWYKETRKSQKSSLSSSTPKSQDAEFADAAEILSHKSTEYRGHQIRVAQDVVAEESNIDVVRPLNQILKENNLNEMAKFLDQSGLDSILNETGPYTIFIPTDKAFKTLEAQLGGPDKAEDKFRENPRLLSGLLLHHVVPGSFRVEDLQDEMTGVSLAGTQLRVNTYTSEDRRSKERSIVTINGAKVSNENKDIAVPQGVAHSIDRVLFPLPIGDILQTLRSDRERRFTKFLKSLDYAGLTSILTGSKTYTVFAPTDKAFSVLTDAELEKLLTKREAAKTIALRHIVPGTLYTAGMNYFQVKDSMETGQKIVIKKELGQIKANSAQIISANIPATNGVIHAVDTLL